MFIKYEKTYKKNKNKIKQFKTKLIKVFYLKQLSFVFLEASENLILLEGKHS
jgi:hypothetical protein